jgi:hypothetical protein
VADLRKFIERGRAAQTAVDHAIGTQVRVLGPEEVEERNIVTAKELRVILKALTYFYWQAPRVHKELVESVKRKIERVLGQMGGGPGASR